MGSRVKSRHNGQGRRLGLLAAALVAALLLLGGCLRDAQNTSYDYNNPNDTTPGASAASGSVVIGYIDALNDVVLITNQSTTPYTLTGWTISSSTNSVTYTFGAVTLLGGHFIRLHTGATASDAVDIYWNVGTDNWSNTADTATLKDASAALVATCAYASAATVLC